MKYLTFFGAFCAVSLAAFSAQACDICEQSEHKHHKPRTVHAPIGVMGDHMHEAGEFMTSYRYMRMDMGGTRVGTDKLSPDEVIMLPNSNPGPANLRVVPTDMSMEMHMIDGMYAPTDWLTLMAMGSYIEKEMDHLTYNMAGERIGGFTTNSSGFGDTSVSGLFRLVEAGPHHVHLNAGVSLPTGSTDEENDVFTPMGTRPTMRLPYGMQLGTGTYDALPGLTYTGTTPLWNWGIQYKARLPLESENDEGYRWGDKHMVTAWGGYQLNEWLNLNSRLSYTTQEAIEGRDSQIAAPVQTADPDNYGGDIAEISVGTNITPPQLKGQYFNIELGTPFYQDLNGPQLERDWHMTAGWQWSF